MADIDNEEMDSNFDYIHGQNYADPREDPLAIVKTDSLPMGYFKYSNHAKKNIS